MYSFSSEISHLENSSEILWGTTDTNFRFLHTNRLFQKHFGLENELWRGRHFPEIVGAFQMEKFLQVNNECLHKPEKTISIEIQTSTATQDHWFKWEISALVNHQDVVMGIRFLGTDITKQKEAEHVLLQQAFLLDNISDAVISTYNNLQIRNWNRQAEMTFFLNTPQHQQVILSSLWKIEPSPGSEGEAELQRHLTHNGSWSGEV